MTVYVATKNAGKLHELRAILGNAGWTALPYEPYADVLESDDSYGANAALKARALRVQLTAAGIAVSVLGDDSGIEVAALDNRPGVTSARYGGSLATWPQRRMKLLAELAERHSAGRAARFVCALHFIDAAGNETAAEAACSGTIAESERGQSGFSYDSLFIGDDGRTFAELSDDEKNRTSHRYRAIIALLTALEVK